MLFCSSKFDLHLENVVSLSYPDSIAQLIMGFLLSNIYISYWGLVGVPVLLLQTKNNMAESLNLCGIINPYKRTAVILALVRFSNAKYKTPGYNYSIHGQAKMLSLTVHLDTFTPRNICQLFDKS